MPEGDSVYQTARRLDAAFAGGVLEVADLRWPSLATVDLRGDTTLEVVSRGKHILHRLSSGRTLHSHLKMEGRWRVRPREKGQRWGDPSVRAVLATSTSVALGTRLGTLDLVATRDEHTLVGHLGPDLLGPDWDSDTALANLAAHPDVPVAAALLDQRNLAGLGTVYVAETLFLQRLSPWTPVGDISPQRLAGTVARAHTLLGANKDTYARTITGSRVEGQQDYVHGRSGQPCRRCGTTVEVAPLDGTQRVVFYCRTCQEGPSRQRPHHVRSAPVRAVLRPVARTARVDDGPRARCCSRTWEDSPVRVTLPPLDEVLASAHVVSLAMRVRFRGVLVREALLLDGPHGWGEFSPFVEYDDEESAAWLASGIEAAWQGWPAARRDRVEVNATVPAVQAEQVGQVLDRFGDCRTVKVKVAEAGQSLADDLARVRAVRAVRPDAAIRVDANGAWSVDAAATALRALAEVGLEYAEQPCARVDDLVALRDRLDRDHVDVVIAADESVRKADDPVRVARTGAVGVAVVKVAPLGGVARTLEVAAELAALGVRVVVSSALDTSVGIAAGVAAAAALPETPLACGLGTVALFSSDVCAEPLLPVSGSLPARATAPVPDPHRFPADGDRTEWWLARLARCWRVLDARRVP